MTLIVKVTEGGQMTRNNLVLDLGTTELQQTWKGGQGKKINIKQLITVQNKTTCDSTVSVAQHQKCHTE